MNTPSTKLTLSAPPQERGFRQGTDSAATRRPIAALRGSQTAVEPVTHIRAELRRISTARRTGAKRTARVHLDRLIDYVWGSGPEDAA